MSCKTAKEQRKGAYLDISSFHSVVFKKNLAYTYFRRFNEMEGAVYFIRILRFSLDGLLVGQIVLLIFFSVTKQSAVYIALTAVLLPINVIVKLLGTRLWKSQCRALEDEEGNALCGIGSSDALTPSANKRDYIGKNSVYGHANDEEQLEYTSPLDARASGRYPPVVVAPQTVSKLLLLWNHLHDLFNANGNDRPSYIVSAQARGSHLSARVVTNAVASAPKVVTKSAVDKSRHLTFVVKLANDKEAHKKAGLQEMEDALPVSTKAFKESLEQRPQDEGKRRKGKAYHQMSLRRSRSVRSTRSMRSEEAPFLSGIDAIANHAPVSSQDLYESDYEDGEISRSVSLQRRGTKDRHEPRSSSYSTTLVKGRPTMDLANQGHLSTPHEVDESYVKDDTAHSIWREEEHAVQGKGEDVDEEGDQEEAEEEGADEEDEDETEDETEDDGDKGEEQALVKPHAKIRWDDTPNNSARYNNPYYSVELDPFLWLPRDPTIPLDLCDTVEWHGAALVSSQGGMGKVGEWNDEQEMEESHHVDGYEEEGLSEAELGSLYGDEEIDVMGPLAQRLQDADDLDDSVDPAASISRDQMDHYKKALDQDEQEHRRHRRFSMRSTSSRHSHRHSAGSDAQMIRVTSGLSGYMTDDADGAIQEQSENEETITAVDFTGRPGIGGEGLTESPLPLTASTVPPSSAGSGVHSGLQASKRREASHAPSNRTAESANEAGAIAPAAATSTTVNQDGKALSKRKISMRKALQAEVLEEEYRRTLKSKLLQKKKREKAEQAEAAAAAAARQSRPTNAKDNDMEMLDLEAQRSAEEAHATDSAIMNRHEHRMHRQQASAPASTSRRDANISMSSVRAVFAPRRSDAKS